MKIQVAVSLGQNRQPVAEPDIVLADARLMRECFPPSLIGSARRRRLAFKVAVVITPKLVLREHGLADRGHHLLAMISDDPRIDRRIERDRIGQMISVI